MAVRKLKRVVIKEELVALTGDFVKAVLLQQLIYWSERTSDFDEFISEEKERMQKFGTSEQEIDDSKLIADINYLDKISTHGWIHKTGDELSEETMLGLSANSIRTHLRKLIEMGFISERKNPKIKWDRTTQYRVNLPFIMCELEKIGYHLEGYARISQCLETKNGKVATEKTSVQRNVSSVQTKENFGAIPEITTEITTETTNRYIEPVANMQLTLGGTGTEQPNSTTKKTARSKVDTIFEDYSNGNQELLTALKDFEEMRKSIKAPMKTERAKKMLLSELSKLAGNNDSLKIAILNQSIFKGWKGVFPLNNGYYQQQPLQQNRRIGDNNAYLESVNKGDSL